MRKSIFYAITLLFVAFSLTSISRSTVWATPSPEKAPEKVIESSSAKNQTRTEEKSSDKAQDNLQDKKESKLETIKTIETEALNSPLASIKPANPIRLLALTDSALTDRDIYSEYGVLGLAERDYGHFLVRIYRTEHPAQAYGLYTFYRDPLATSTDFGTEGDMDVVEGRVIFWQGARFVEISDTGATRKDAAQLIKLSKAVSDRITELDARGLATEDVEAAKVLPAVIRNLPEGSLSLRTTRYILGPKALARLLKRSVDQYEFYPNFGSEIALATYEQGKGETSLMIIEYHTPQQASSALTRLTKYYEGLSEAERAKNIIKRQGNYIVEAINFNDAAIAKKTVEDVKYNYIVKWLDNDVGIAVAQQKRFNSEASKTASLLVSVMSLIGISLMVALVFGVGFGFIKFYLKRRDVRYVAAYTDGGGMMRLNLDGIEAPSLPATKDGRNLLEPGD